MPHVLQPSVLAGTTDLVPTQLYEATRASQEEAAAQVAELQQQLAQQAAAQQVRHTRMCACWLQYGCALYDRTGLEKMACG
jgi:hypothetical protein